MYTRLSERLFDYNRVNIFRFVYWGDILRADYCSQSAFETILVALMPPNRLAILVSLTTGLRLGDVLSLKTEALTKERFTIKEEKTGKTRRVRLSNELRDALFSQAGRFYVFEHRTDPKKHRTRQAVYKDLARACELFRVKGVHLSPHSARKIYAVSAYKRTCSIERVQELLNHSSEAVTMLYAMADAITMRDSLRRTVRLPDAKEQVLSL